MLVTITVCAGSRAVAQEKPAPEQVQPHELLLDIPNAVIAVYPPLPLRPIEPRGRIFHAEVLLAGDHFTPMTDWEVSCPGATEFHLRPRGNASFWKVDLARKSAFLVLGAGFGISGARGELVAQARVEPAGKVERIAGESAFRMNLPLATLTLKIDGRRGEISLGGLTVPLAEDRWRLSSERPGVYWLRQDKVENSNAWELDTRALEVRRGADPIGSVRAAWPRSPAETAAGIQEDAALERIAAPPGPTSTWYRAERETYRRLLLRRRWDVMVPPFQVDGLAVDRQARSLLARYLAARIEAGGERVAPVTLVGRVLGETARVFDEADIYRLAEESGARLLLRGYAGQDRKGRLRITLLVQQRTSGGRFGDPEVLSWPTIAFTDEFPPEEAFRSVIDEVVSRLPLKRRGEPATPRREAVSPHLTFSQDVAAFFPGVVASPLERALRLEFLGSLVPEEGPIREAFFERALLALAESAQDAPGAAILRARALNELGRRPAAVTALGTPATPAEQALAAFLDGDLGELSRLVATIPDPTERILASVDLADLAWTYGREPATAEMDLAASMVPTPWSLLVRARLLARSRVPAVETARAIQELSRQLLPQAAPETDAERSLPDIRRKALAETTDEALRADDAAAAVRRDLLELLGELGRADALQSVRATLILGGSPAGALQMLDRFEPAYGGHPDFAYLRAEALRRIGGADANAEATVALYRNALFWWGGQRNNVREGRSGFPLSSSFMQPRYLWSLAYDEDWPRRPRWAWGVRGDRDALDRQALTGRNVAALDPALVGYDGTELWMLYSSDDGGALDSYLRAIGKERGVAARQEFLRQNESRFRGAPARMNWIEGKARLSGLDEESLRSFEREIATNPGLWRPYVMLGNLWLYKGEFAKAAEVYGRYPLFRSAQVQDRVALANNAYVAGENLMRRGEVDLARPFFEIAARAGSGAEAELFASMNLAIFDERFADARDWALKAVERYGDASACTWAVFLTGMLGEGERARALLEAGSAKTPRASFWLPELVNRRLRGATDEETLAWLSTPQVRDSSLLIVEAMVMMFSLDRVPHRALPEWIRDVNLAAVRARGQRKPPKEAEADLVPNPVHVAWVAGATGDFEHAARIFDEAAPYSQWGKSIKGPALVSAVLAAYKTGKGASAGQAIEAFKPQLLSSPGGFDYLLAKALLKGESGDHETAVAALRQGLANIHTNENVSPAMYRLVETCERLFVDTGNERYRDLALAWARDYRRVYPAYAWAWAVEATFTDDPEQQRRALRAALYLDRHSARANALPDPERRSALAWLEHNNPFRLPDAKADE